MDSPIIIQLRDDDDAADNDDEGTDHVKPTHVFSRSRGSATANIQRLRFPLRLVLMHCSVISVLSLSYCTVEEIRYLDRILLLDTLPGCLAQTVLRSNWYPNTHEMFMLINRRRRSIILEVTRLRHELVYLIRYSSVDK